MLYKRLAAARASVVAAPVIVSAPEHVKNVTGSSVAILCEAKGYPIPTVEWTWMRVDGQMVYLPSESTTPFVASERLYCGLRSRGPSVQAV